MPLRPSAALTCALLTLSLARAEDPSWYARRASWPETLLASRDRLLASPEPGPRRPLPDLGASDFTFLAWVRTLAGGSLLAKCPRDGDWLAQGKAFFIREGRLTVDVGWVGSATGRRVLDGQWHQVGLSKRGSHLSFWVDGQSDGETELPFGPDPAGSVCKLGWTSANFPDDGFSGDLDDVRLFGRALDAAQVAQWYTAPDRADASGLLGWWPFEAEGLDASGSGNHAVRVGTVAYTAGHQGQAVTLDGRQSGFMLVGGPAAVQDSLWALLGRDFTSESARTELAWERDDGLWRGEVHSGDWTELARRYAAAAHAQPRSAGDWAGVLAARRVYLGTKRLAALTADLPRLNLDGLRLAIGCLGERFPDAYPRAALLARLERVSGALTACRQAAPELAAERLPAVEAELRALRHEALESANPLLKFDRLLFVKRFTYQSSHSYTDYIDGCRYFGGSLCVLDRRDGHVRELAPTLAGGLFGRYDLSFDGTRVVFDYKRQLGEGFRLWTVNVDGSGLRQLTFPPADEPRRIARYKLDERYPHHTDDLQPCWLPDGGIAFVSTRCEFSVLNDPADLQTVTNLYRLNADGTGLRPLTHSALSESFPSVLNDGRLAFTRWEHVDRGAASVQRLWAVNPDGTAGDALFHGDATLPPTLLQARAVPGRDDLVVAVGDPPARGTGVGALFRLGLGRLRGPGSTLTRCTPAPAPLFADPYPLDEAFCLVAANADKPAADPSAYGLYLRDQWGNQVPLYSDHGTSCWQPTPLRARPAPRTRRAPTAAPGTPGTLYLGDVYQGLPGVARGSIKWLRVLEQVPRPWSARRTYGGDLYDQQHACLTQDTHLGLKVLHGVVPVAADGSACFTVPSDRALYFEALDADFMEVQRMRTYINVRPGEQRACVGCHADGHHAPPDARPAARRAPDAPGPQPGEVAPRPLDYASDVQPLLDRHCASCHNADKPDGGLVLTGEPTLLWNRSYEALLAKRLLPVISENHPPLGSTELLPPFSLGSHAAKLTLVVKQGHYNVKLSLAEWVKLTTFVDTNAQYYGSYFGRRNLVYQGLPDFRPVPTLSSALGVPPG